MHRLAAALLIALTSPALADPFVSCWRGQPAAHCVYDGDTLWLDGEKIRVAGYDAPEMGAPLCHKKSKLGNASRDALIGLLNSGEVSLGPVIERSWDRDVRAVFVNGADVAGPMLRSGLARQYHRGAGAWC